MELQDSKILVAGATGELGGHVARELHGQGAELFLAGRDEQRLGLLAGELGVPAGGFDLQDRESCEEVVASAAEVLRGLDVLFVCTGATAFGEAGELDLETTEELFAVNLLGPIALIRAALPKLGERGAVVAFSAVVADFPTAEMAAYSASKAGLSAYLVALRHERRQRGLTVLDLRPQHMATGFCERALAGSPPELPEPLDPVEVVRMAVDALRAGKRELAWDLKYRELVAH
jgi:short-subunit dehydrogenase